MRLKQLRVLRKMRQRDVAELLNCSTPVYCRYETGEREPPFDVLVTLADFYSVTIDYLMGRDTPPESIPAFMAELTPDNRRFIEEIARQLLENQRKHGQ